MQPWRTTKQKLNRRKQNQTITLSVISYCYIFILSYGEQNFFIIKYPVVYVDFIVTRLDSSVGIKYIILYVQEQNELFLKRL